MSTYRRFPAPAVLRGVVEHAWVVRQEGPTREVALPDGHAVVQVVLGEAGVLLDPMTGEREPDGTGVRGVLSRTRVREHPGAGVRLGVQLHPAGPARLSAGAAGSPTPIVGPDRFVGLDRLVPPSVGERVEARLSAGDDEGAAAALLAALADRPRHESVEADRLAEVLQVVAQHRGLVRSTDLARGAGVSLGELHRWFVHVTGLDPAAHLAAVRFSTFVRDAVGPGSVAPQSVVAAIEWYVQAAYPPREVERFTGLPPADLRRLADRLGELIAA